MPAATDPPLPSTPTPPYGAPDLPVTTTRSTSMNNAAQQLAGRLHDGTPASGRFTLSSSTPFTGGGSSEPDHGWEDDREEEGDSTYAEPYDVALLPDEHRAHLPVGTTASRCTGCGDIRINRPDVPLDEWKNHWPDECEDLQAAGGR